MKSLLVLAILLPLLVQGQQNLVPNGSFENYSSCPGTDNDWPIAYWSRTNASPDYFNACVSGNFEQEFLDTPCNNRGCQVPKSGDAYIGFFPFALNGADASEYIQAELLHPIVSSIRYLVQFYVSPAENYGYAVATIGAAFTVLPPPVIVPGHSIGMLDADPQILNASGAVTDTSDWTLISDTLMSRYGGEKFISIGNFSLDIESDTILFNPNAQQWSAAYYYIDDVSVVALDSIPSGVGEVEQNQGTYHIYPNPSNGSFTLNYSLEKGEEGMIEIFDLLGQIVYHQQLNQTGFQSVDLDGISSGIYSLRVIINGSLRVAEKLSVLPK